MGNMCVLALLVVSLTGMTDWINTRTDAEAWQGWVCWGGEVLFVLCVFFCLWMAAFYELYGVHGEQTPCLGWDVSVVNGKRGGRKREYLCCGFFWGPALALLQWNLWQSRLPICPKKRERWRERKRDGERERERERCVLGQAPWLGHGPLTVPALLFIYLFIYQLFPPLSGRAEDPV